MSNMTLAQQVPAPNVPLASGSKAASNDVAGASGNAFSLRLDHNAQAPLPADTMLPTPPPAGASPLDFPPPQAFGGLPPAPLPKAVLAALLHLYALAKPLSFTQATAALAGSAPHTGVLGGAVDDAPRRSPSRESQAAALAAALLQSQPLSLQPLPAAPAAEAPSLPLRRLSEALAKVAGGSMEQVHLRVDPPELGHLNIRVQVRGNAVYFSIEADSQVAAAALVQHIETHLQDLQHELRNVNLTLGGYDLHSQDGKEHASYRTPTREAWEPPALTEVVPNPQTVDVPVRAPRGVVDVIA